MNLRSTFTPAPPRASVAALIHRLVARLERRPPAPADAGATPPRRIAPPGSRSGEGSDSVLPYLAESLQTRPGPLDD